MLSRWQTLEALFANQTVYALERRDPAASDAFTGAATYEPSPAYAWVTLRDVSQHGGSALAAMASVGIRGRDGVAFGGTRAQCRLELLMREETFQLLAEKLRFLLHPAPLTITT